MLVWMLTGSGEFRDVPNAAAKALASSGRAQIVSDALACGEPLRYAAHHPDVLAGKRPPPRFAEVDSDDEAPPPKPVRRRRGRYPTKVMEAEK